MQPQAGPPPDEPFFAVEQLRQAVHAIGAEQFSAIRVDKQQCQYCEFTARMPGQGRRRLDPRSGRHDRRSYATRSTCASCSASPFTQPQMAAITAGLDRPSAIIAGAGSGKTTVMAARVVWLVGHEGIAPERILGLTFTNKAAAELGQRIRASLERLGRRSRVLGWGDPRRPPITRSPAR